MMVGCLDMAVSLASFRRAGSSNKNGLKTGGSGFEQKAAKITKGEINSLRPSRPSVLRTSSFIRPSQSCILPPFLDPMNIESHLVENRVFKPSRAFSKAARIGDIADYRKLYKASIENPEKFWAKQAAKLFWQKEWTKVLQWKCPFAKWFVGGKINASENCLDRHLTNGRR